MSSTVDKFLDKENGKFKYLKQFDAFPKVAEHNENEPKKGLGFRTILFYSFALFFTYCEFGSLFDGYIEETFGVQPGIQTDIPVNIDIFVKTKCEFLDFNWRDGTGDHLLVNELIKLEKMPFFVPYNVKSVNDFNEIYTPNIDEIFDRGVPAEFREAIDTSRMEGAENFNGCHIFGSINVNRVAGQLQITGKGYGYYSENMAPIEQLDFTHVINELSFGPFLPFLNNPLDNIAQIPKEEDKNALFKYGVTVVPTRYEKLGGVIDTTQYSVTFDAMKSDLNFIGKKITRVPGIFINVKHESITVIYSDKRIGFLQFLGRLLTIGCLLMYLASWLYMIADKFYTLNDKRSLYGSKPNDMGGIIGQQK
ncbi:hypothetical protein QEN19_004415 [Hanseniaspora menglaensis]